MYISKWCGQSQPHNPHVWVDDENSLYANCAGYTQVEQPPKKTPNYVELYHIPEEDDEDYVAYGLDQDVWFRAKKEGKVLHPGDTWSPTIQIRLEA